MSQQPLIPANLEQFFKSQVHKKEEKTPDITLKEFTHLFNKFKEVGVRIEKEGSFTQQKELSKDNHDIEERFKLPNAQFAFYTSDKKLAFVVVSKEEIYQVNCQTQETTKLSQPQNSTDLKAATVSKTALYLGFFDGQLLKYDSVSLEWTILPRAHDTFVKSMLVTPNQKYFISCADDRSIMVWTPKDSLVQVIQVGYEGGELLVSKDSTYIVVASQGSFKANQIKFFELETFQEIDMIDLPADSSYLSFNADESAIQFQIGDQAYEYQINPTLNISKLASFQYPIHFLEFSKNSRYLGAGSLDGSANVWDFKERKQIFKIDQGGLTFNTLVTSDNKYVIAGGQFDTINIYEIKLHEYTYTEVKKIPVKFEELQGMSEMHYLMNDESRLVVNHQDSKYFGILNWQTATWEIHGPFESNIQRISQSKDGSKFYMTLKNCNVLEWDFYEQDKDQKIKKRLNTHVDVWKALATSNGELLITAGDTLLAWDLQNEIIIEELNGHSSNVQDIRLSSRETELFSAGFDKTIKIWNLQDFSILFSVTIETSRWCMNVSSNDQWIVTTGWDNHMRVIENPLLTKIVKQKKKEDDTVVTQLESLDKSCISHSEISYYKQLKQKKGNSDLLLNLLKTKNQIFFPFKFTALHILVANGNAECIAKALDLGYPYIKDYQGKTPLTYAFELKYLNCVDEIAKYINGSEQDFIITKEDFFLMFSCSIPSVKELFGKVLPAIQQNIEGYLPEFGIHEKDLFKFKENAMIRQTEVKECIGDLTQENIQPIEFLVSKFKLNLSAGSQESLNILSKFVEADPEIFRTNICAIIDYKWSRYSWIFKMQSFIFYFYLGMIWMQVLYYNQIFFVVLVQILTSILILYECLQCYANKEYYVTDFWNYFDFTGFMIIFISNILIEFQIEVPNKGEFFSLGLLIMFLRGVSYLRPFDQTRYLVGMISAIVNDMTSFFIILIYSMLGLACIQVTLTTESELTLLQYLSEVITFYRLSMGEWDFSGFTGFFLLFIFIVSTLLFPLILMNLLIAMMGDTYSRVQDKIIPVDYALKAQLIWEIESIMFHRRNRGEEKFMLVYRKKGLENENAEAEGQLRQIKVNTMHILNKLNKKK